MKSILFTIFGTALLFTTASESAKECRNEQYRLQLHFTPASNWINDPNGMVFYDGEYHLHYQYHPNSTIWGPMHWGHAVSTDLLHWTELPIALYPDQLGDIFSGSAIVDLTNSTGFRTDANGPAPLVAMFTHAAGPKNQIQQQSLAISLDKGRTYQQYPGNPVIPNPNGAIPDFRDPKVISYKGMWHVALAAGRKIMFYSSPDMKSWTYLSEFGAGYGPEFTGGVWECPDLMEFKVNDQTYWVLLVSINPGGPNGGSVTQYFVGNYNGSVFTSEQAVPLWMDWGADNYAGVTFFNDPSKRYNYMAWMNNWNYANFVPTGKYRGQMTLPRILSLVNVPEVGLRLKSEFAAEVLALRNPQQNYVGNSFELAKNVSLAIEPGFSNDLLELEMEFNISKLEGSSRLEIRFLNAEESVICFGYEHATRNLFIERSPGSFSSNFSQRITADRTSKNAERLKFHAIVDVSAIELLVDDGLTAMTALFYSQKPVTSLAMKFVADSNAGVASLIQNRIHGLKSIYDCSVSSAPIHTWYSAIFSMGMGFVMLIRVRNELA